MQAQIRASGVADATGGTKTNEVIPGCPILQKISFGYGWTTAYMDKTTADSTFKAPQDPAKDYGWHLDEPVSKKAYSNGVLEWRKDTVMIAGGHPPCPDKVVYYNGKWMGYLSNKALYQPGKIITINVDSLYNSLGQGQAWIDQYIDKLTRLLGGKYPARQMREAMIRIRLSRFLASLIVAVIFMTLAPPQLGTRRGRDTPPPGREISTHVSIHAPREGRDRAFGG